MAFNEVASLEAVVREVDATLGELRLASEIVIVDDGSTDGTGVVADRLAEKLSRVQVIHHAENKGLGGVYRTGFTRAQGDLITFLPGDGQFPASIVAAFVSLIGNKDMVLGYLPSRERPFLARTLSAVERMLYRILFGPLPRFQGVLMFRRTLLEELELESTGRGWAVLMELIVRASRGGYRIVCVPTEIRPRTSGRSKVNNLSTVWANLKQVVVLRYHLWGTKS